MKGPQPSLVQPLPGSPGVMPPHASWRHLGVGIVALSAVMGIALLILVFGRVGRLRGDKITLFVTTNAARGLARGSEVWLDGQRVGTVNDIDFRSPSTSPSERLTLSIRVLDNAKALIRRDSRVQIRSGGSILGAPVVQLSSGTVKQPPVHEGDTLRTTQPPDMETFASEFAIASREFPSIIANVKVLASQLQAASGTLGAFSSDADRPSLDQIRARAARLANGISNPHGSIGLALRGRDSLRLRAAGAMAQVDSVRTLLASDRHSLGRFRRDSTIKLQLTRIRTEMADVQKLLGNQGGTIGRLRTDSAIVMNLRRGLVSIDSLMIDIKKRPLRYIAF